MIGKCSSSPESAARLTSKVQGEGEGEDHRGQDLRPEGTSHAEGLSGLGARRVLRPVVATALRQKKKTCVVRRSCVGKAPLPQFWASAVCSCASPDPCGRPATAGTFGHGSCHGGASVGCSETPPLASCGPFQIHVKRFLQCPQKLQVPLTKNRSKNEIRPVPRTSRHAPLSSTSPSHRSKCTQFGAGQPIQILNSGLRGTPRRATVVFAGRLHNCGLALKQSDSTVWRRGRWLTAAIS
jgi:hypothetical protein